MRHLAALATMVVAWSLTFSTMAAGQPALVIKPLAEKKIAQLPAGPLYWRLETFATRADAERVVSPLGLIAESAGKVWLFTLGSAGAAPSPGGTKIAEIGPLPPVVAPEYLLRVNQATGPPGSITPVHTHPGSEAFYVLSGEQTIRTTHGTVRVAPGRPETGHGADVPMQVSSSGATDLHALVVFVVDATRPFTSPARFAALDVFPSEPILQAVRALPNR